MSYYDDLNKAKALGLEYANNGIAAGDTSPEESPLSGEWAGAVTVDDIARMLGVVDPATLDDFEREDIADYWEDGYFSANWPEED